MGSVRTSASVVELGRHGLRRGHGAAVSPYDYAGADDAQSDGRDLGQAATMASMTTAISV